jgi:hypothetical protein
VLPLLVLFLLLVHPLPLTEIEELLLILFVVVFVLMYILITEFVELCRKN